MHARTFGQRVLVVKVLSRPPIKEADRRFGMWIAVALYGNIWPMVPLRDFDFAILDSEEFGEDSVREEIIAPLLRALEYGVSGPERIVRSRRLEHPFVAIGATEHRISIIPDYTLLVDNRPAWVLDAKSPRESVDDPKHDAQVYSYAIHRDVRVDWYAICNGREFALFHVGDMSPVPRLRFDLRELSQRWAEIHTFLRPRGRIHAGKQFDKDFGILLLRLGLKETCLHFLGVELEHPQLGRVKKGLYTMSRRVHVEESPYLATFDFDDERFEAFLNKLSAAEVPNIRRVFEQAPTDASISLNVVGHLGAVNLECKLGELQENDREHYLPLLVAAVS